MGSGGALAYIPQMDVGFFTNSLRQLLRVFWIKGSRTTPPPPPPPPPLLVLPLTGFSILHIAGWNCRICRHTAVTRRTTLGEE